MALTEAKIKDLVAKKFDRLLDNEWNQWSIMAEAAYGHAQEFITDGRIPRPDDVAKVLLPMLEVDERLRRHQEDNYARAKRFTEWFTEYVIDKYLGEKANADD